MGDIESKQLRVIKRDENGVSIVDNNLLEETYGHTVESILVNTMKLKNTRNDKVSDLLNEIRSILRQDLYESDEFKSLFSRAKEYLGTLDKDIVLINMDIKKRELKSLKDNAKYRQN